MRKTFPTLEQVRELPLALRRTVPPEFEDVNGHINIQHYMGLYDEAGWAFFATMGVDQRYMQTERCGIFDLEHHLHYQAEVLVGEDVSIYGRFLGGHEKRVHGMWFMVNEPQGTLASSMEFVTAHVNLESRRTAPWPQAVYQEIDALTAAHRSLAWKAPVCGSMST